MQEAQGGKEKKCKNGNSATQGKYTDTMVERRLQVCKDCKGKQGQELRLKEYGTRSDYLRLRWRDG